MKKYLRPVAWLLAVLLAFTCCGCGLLERFLPDTEPALPPETTPEASAVVPEPTPAPTESETELALQAKAELTNYRVSTDGAGEVSMTAQVAVPDYSFYMAQVCDAAAERAQNEEEFEKILYELTLEAVENAGEPVRTVQEFTVRLSDVNPEKVQADWMYDELIALSQDIAFTRETDEFCLEILAAYYPTTLTEESEGDAE